MKAFLLLTLIFSLIPLNHLFSQNDDKSSVIGNPSIMESAANIVADNAGNTYVGGLQGNKGLIVKQNAFHVTQWSKTLSFTTNPNEDVTIAFLDIVGDTVFGCGKIHQFNLSIGTFYFKMNAQTGVMYWSKYELVSDGYLSCMRYSNGKFFLIGGVYGWAQVTLGKALAVSSQTGAIIWETPLLKYVIPATSMSATTRNYFLNSTEVKNGQFYITGYSDGNTSSTTNWLGLPILIGITETGTVFLEKYLLLPYGSNVTQRFEGAKILWDMDDNLVISCYEISGGANPNGNIVIKCDLAGNILFSNVYNIAVSGFCTVDAMNETATSYVFFGYNSYTTGAFEAPYVLKIDKNGNLEACKRISKPYAIYNSLGAQWTHLVGNSSFINGKHYFTMEESFDINQFVLDEDLNYIDDCSELGIPPVEVIPIQVSMPQVIASTVPNNFIFQDGAILEDVPVFAYCDNVSLDLSQNTGCGQTDITATIAGFTDPVFYWSNGAGNASNSITVNTTDTVFVRVTDLKCCELIDTIVPVLATSAFAMNLPADTTVCLQTGASFTVIPTFSGANGSVDYLWNNNSTGSSLLVNTSGTYWVAISDSCLTLRDSIVITVNSLPVIGNTSNIKICEGSFPATLNPTVSAGATVLWDDGTTTINRSVNSPGSYTISATNDCGTVNATIVVSQTDLPTVQLEPLIDTCIQNGTTITLVPVFTGTTTVSWSNGSAGNQLPVSASGMYTVYASNNCGVDSASSSVTINYFPELNLPATLDTCFEIGVGFAYTAQGSVGSYQWNSGSNTATEWISQEGIYTCTLTNQCGSVTETMQVRRLTAVDLYFPNDSIKECAKQFAVSNLQIETNYTLEIFGPGEELIGNYLTESGWYRIHAFNACGEKWDSIYVNLQNEQFFYLPNSFTPNGDSYNDRFEFKGENIVLRDVRIFNRWGEEIFTESGAFTGWNGTYRGEICPDGIYAVHLIYEDCFGIPTEFSGHVNLIR